MKKNKKLLGVLLLAAVVILLLISFNHKASQAPAATEAPQLSLVSSAPSTAAPLPEPEADTQTEQEADVQPEPEAEAPAETAVPPAGAEASLSLPDEDGTYTSKDDVALYLHTYGHLPSNFITKTEARAAGWDGGSVERYFPGMCIGGDTFYNMEGLLPDAPGRTWQECDINTLGKSSRGAKRLVFSNDGLIYYTKDHYESFELLYGEP